MLLVMRLSKGMKKLQRTFLIIMVEEGCGNDETLPREIIEVLNDFKDVISKEFLKNLPLNREVDHKIKLVPEATIHGTLTQVPLKLEELHR